MRDSGTRARQTATASVLMKRTVIITKDNLKMTLSMAPGMNSGKIIPSIRGNTKMGSGAE